MVAGESSVGVSNVDGKSPQNYGEWFNEKVLGLDSPDYRHAFWREVHATGHTMGHIPRTLDSLLREQCGSRVDAQCGLLLAFAFLQGGIYPFWLLARLLSREVYRLRRGTYYARERERRHRLADERHAIQVRRTVNPKPSLDEIRTAWNQVRATVTRGRSSGAGVVPAADAVAPRNVHTMAVLRLGALLEDLERYVDNHAYVTRGIAGIRGRAPGIKGVFANEAPDLREVYKAVMRYKALAKRYRQACGCVDPIPEEALLPVQESVDSVLMSSSGRDPSGVVTGDFTAERLGVWSAGRPASGETRVVGGVAFPVLPCLGDVASLEAWMAEHGNTAYLRTQDWVRSPDRVYSERHLLREESLGTAAEILRFGDGTLVALEAAIALRIDPDCVPRDTVSAEGGDFASAHIVRCLGGRRSLRVAKRVRMWLSQRRRPAADEGSTVAEGVAVGD